MNSNKPNNTLAIIGLVLGIIAILFSFIPCIGTIAFIPGIIGLILGVIALLKAKDNGEPKGMAIAVVVISVIACAISGFQMATIGSFASGVKSDLVDYASCEDLTKDFEITADELATVSKDLESDSPSFSNISKVAKLGMKMNHIKTESMRLECDLDFDEFDPSKFEKVIEETIEASEEAESIESEKGN